MLLWSLQMRDRTADRMSYQEHAMSTRLIARVPAAAFAACLCMSAMPALAQMAPPALVGKVTSDRDGAMEGVLVSAKKPGGTITVTVVSDAKGDYAFPADRLEGGRYELTITAADFLKVFERMSGYYPGASDLQPQRLVGEHRRPAVNRAIAEKLADYLASVNLSRQSTHDFEPKISPRPTGRATRVIITEYDLPRKEIQPHDVIVDPTGTVWFSHFGEQFLSKLDPNTGKVTDFPIPVQKLNHPKGTLDLEIDADGYLWVGLMYQTGMARFDRTTETFKIFPVPDEWQTDATQQSHFSVAATKVDGKAWVKNTDRSQVMRLDLATGKYENLGSFRDPVNNRPIGIYGIYADQQNNAYILEFPFGGIGKIDAKTGKLAFYPTPTSNARA